LIEGEKMIDENFVTLIYVSVIMFIVFAFFGFWIQKSYANENKMSAYEHCLDYCQSSITQDSLQVNCFSDCNVNNLTQNRVNQECYFGNYVKTDSGWKFDLKQG
jgi:hypothetical protein